MNRPGAPAFGHMNLEIPDQMIASVVTSKLLRLRRLKWLTSEVLRAE